MRYAKRFARWCSLTAREINQVSFSSKLGFAGLAFVVWFAVGALVMLAAPGVTHSMGTGFDTKTQRQAAALEELAKKDPSHAAEYRREAKAWRSTDGVFTEASNVAAGYIPSWWQGGVLLGGLWAAVVLIGALAVAAVDAVFTRWFSYEPALI